MSKLRVLDLFSGIGGFSLGLERTGGFETVAFCEIEPFPRRVLAKHWPEVPCYDDVRTLTEERLRADGICVDVICGGFPCQDISLAGIGAGIAEGTRSGLWSEIARLAGELRPSFVIVENVSALLGRGLDRVLGDMAALGYDAEWHCIPASALGASHRRDRLWLVAYPHVAERGQERGARQRMAWAECLSQWQEGSGRSEPSCEALANSASERCREAGGFRCNQSEEWIAGCSEDVSDANRCDAQGLVCRSNDPGKREKQIERPAGLSCRAGSWPWSSEPDVGRMAHGVPARVDRLRALGNAVVPQIPELIGNAILASLSRREAA